MDTEKDFEELTGAGVDSDDTSALTEVVDDEELPVEVGDETLVTDDDGTMGEEDEEDAELVEYMFGDDGYNAR